MAKLSICLRCWEIRDLMKEGRAAQAEKMAAAHLRELAVRTLQADMPCLVLAADLLDPPAKRAADRPIQDGPRDWIKIAGRVDELREAKHRSPVKQAAKEFRCSRGHVTNAMKAMKAARQAAGEN
jgi:hypothetical protein